MLHISEEQIVTATGAGEALIKLEREKFALIILDDTLQDLDSVRLAHYIRDINKNQDAPILMLVDEGAIEDVCTQCRQISSIDYLLKPINEYILNSRVMFFLDLYNKKNRLQNVDKALTRHQAEMQRFAYVCSHDLQEPARMMNIFSTMLEQNYAEQLDEAGREYIQFITSNATHLKRMIGDIISFTRVGHDPIEIEEVDSREVVDVIVATFFNEIDLSQANIRIENLPVIKTSPLLFSTIMDNLISNSLKFYANGCVPEIKISASETQFMWVFSVEDNGIGILPDHEDLIFAPFQRVHSRHKYAGTCIGLSTCRKMVELYGGAIWFKSEINSGTTFFFSIPKADTELEYGTS